MRSCPCLPPISNYYDNWEYFGYFLCSGGSIESDIIRPIYSKSHNTLSRNKTWLQNTTDHQFRAQSPETWNKIRKETKK